jgi:thioredoxin reductase (NADPH)
LSADVVLFLHTAPALTEEQADQIAARGVRVVEEEVVALEIERDRLAGVRLRTGECVPRQVVVVAPLFKARAEVLRGLGVETADREMAEQTLGTFAPADATGATSASGVWVAGNITEPSAQVLAAAAGGLKAGAVINADLAAEDAARAVAARHETPGRDSPEI